MTEEWLNPDELCIIPFNSRMIIVQMIYANLSLVFDNTESPIAGSIPPYGGNPYKWIMRIFAPVSLGGRVELIVCDNANEYDLACSQMNRYIRYLMKQYPHYNPVGALKHEP